MKFSSNIFVTALFCAIFFILGILTYKLVISKPNIKEKKSDDKELRSQFVDRKFTNPLLDCEADYNYITPELENKILQKAEFLKKNSLIENISVYYRDLSNGSWYGVNEREKFIPASLNKVPLMIAAFKLSEEYPEVLNYKFTFNETLGVFKKIAQDEVLNNGQKTFGYYDLIEFMIRFSHNETAGFLIEMLNAIDNKFVSNVFLDLGLTPPSLKDVHQLTAKSYASFFRVLYNSTYINNKNSERALYYLSENEFKSGIVKGIEDNVIIAHKYGQIEEEKLLQLHDCGIVYYPGNTYVLCVMVKGYGFNEMQSVIQQISKTVYEEVKRQTKNN